MTYADTACSALISPTHIRTQSEQTRKQYDAFLEEQRIRQEVTGARARGDFEANFEKESEPADNAIVHSTYIQKGADTQTLRTRIVSCLQGL